MTFVANRMGLIVVRARVCCKADAGIVDNCLSVQELVTGLICFVDVDGELQYIAPSKQGISNIQSRYASDAT